MKQAKIVELGFKVQEIIESYDKQLPTYEIGHQLICAAARLMFHTAPSDLVAMKTIMASIEHGINLVQQDRE